MNANLLVNFVSGAVRVAERVGLAAVATYFTQSAIPALAANGIDGAWKTVLLGAGYAALHAEVGAISSWLASKAKPATPQGGS